MNWELTEEEYNNYQIAREGDDCYFFYGYVAVVKDRTHAAILDVSHCSCYGTWESGQLESGSVTWTGTLKQLLRLAERQEDPVMPRRKVLVEDCQGNYLLALYQSILTWYEKSEYYR